MINISKLQNGLTVVTDTIPTVETATLGMWVPVGSRFESKSVNGISHLLEHMAFKGTTTRSAQEIAMTIESSGGYLNASTSRETTSYYARVLREDVPVAIDVLSDILQNSTFSSQELEKERSVVIQEILESQDTPDDIVFDYFQETAYPDQPVGRSILGPVDIISEISRDDLVAYVSQNYTSQNMVFCASGRVDHDNIVDLISQKFTSLNAVTPATPAAAQYQGGIRCEVKKLEQTQWVLGLPGISSLDPRFYTAAVLSTLLGGGMSSRLFQEVREKRGLVYTIQAYNIFYRDAGMLGVYASTQSKDIPELTRVVYDQLHTLQDTLTDQEVLRARTQLKAGTLMGLESTSARCERAAHQTLLFGRVFSLEETIQSIDAVEKEDVIALLSTLLSGAATLTTLGDRDFSSDLSKIFK